MKQERLVVHYENQPIYDIVFKNSYQNLIKELEFLNIKNKKLCIVTDSIVEKLYASEVTEILTAHSTSVTIFSFKSGEASKNITTVQKLYEHLILNKFDRKDMLLALGGGVVGDLTGFVAATYLRGIDFIQLPTTLLSQVDSSIGGKTGVDFESYKNMVGAFYQPKLVYMNLSTLNSLNDKDFNSGISEIYKHGLIKDKEYYEWLVENINSIQNRDIKILAEMIFRSCDIKRKVVENDPREKGERALLNLGHTIGHSIEKLTNFTMLHGECVSVGIVSACFISWKRGFLSEIEFQQIKEHLVNFKLPTCIVSTGINANIILETTKLDKKMEAGHIKFVLLNAIGDAFIDNSISDLEILESINHILVGDRNEECK